MPYSSTVDLFSSYMRAYNSATQPNRLTAPKIMTRESYNEYVNNPSRQSKNITEEEYAQIMKVIEDGESSADEKVKASAQKMRKELEALAQQSYFGKCGVTEEEFKNGNRGSYDQQLREANTQEANLLRELDELNNASFIDKLLDIFTGNLSEKRERIQQSLLNIAEMKDYLNAKITYTTILNTKF